MHNVGLVTLVDPTVRPIAGAIIQDGFDLECPWHHHDMHQLQYAFEGSMERWSLRMHTAATCYRVASQAGFRQASCTEPAYTTCDRRTSVRRMDKGRGSL
jgi:hypothetical protein